MSSNNRGKLLLRLVLGAAMLAVSACDHTAHDSCDPNNASACPSGQICGACSTSQGSCNVCGTSGQDCTCS